MFFMLVIASCIDNETCYECTEKRTFSNGQEPRESKTIQCFKTDDAKRKYEETHTRVDTYSGIRVTTRMFCREK